MVIFDQLRISDSGKAMYIDLHVNKAQYFDNIYLDNIVITTGDQISETDPYAPTENYIYKKTFGEDCKSVSLGLSATDFIKTWETDAKAMNFTTADMSKTLFFVYVTCKGTVGECTPCRLDELVTLGVTFDDKMLYQRVMGYTKRLTEECKIPESFTDFILVWNAFKASIETDHYIPAIKYWNMLFGDTAVTDSNNFSCNCNG